MRRIAIVLFVLAACESTRGPADVTKDNALPPPTPPSPVDQRMKDACAGLVKAGCPEGGPTCVADLAQAEGQKEHVDYACFAKAIIPDDVRACGGLGKLVIRCRP